VESMWNEVESMGECKVLYKLRANYSSKRVYIAGRTEVSDIREMFILLIKVVGGVMCGAEFE